MTHSNILRFAPARFAGIVVLCLPKPLHIEAIEDALRRFLVGSAGKDLSGKLWIIDAPAYASSRDRRRHDKSRVVEHPGGSDGT
jgi:hypothetical protein